MNARRHQPELDLTPTFAPLLALCLVLRGRDPTAQYAVLAIDAQQLEVPTGATLFEEGAPWRGFPWCSLAACAWRGVHPAGTRFGWVGVVPLLTAAMGFCPFSTVPGLSSCPMRAK